MHSLINNQFIIIFYLNLNYYKVIYVIQLNLNARKNVNLLLPDIFVFVKMDMIYSPIKKLAWVSVVDI